MAIHTYELNSLTEQPDAILAKQAINGEEKAFEILVRRYQSPIFSFVYHFVKDYDLTCDITQQVFLRFYSTLPNLKTEEPFKGWLFQVARHCCIDEMRRKHRQAIPFSRLDLEKDDEGRFSLDDIPDFHALPDEEAERHDLQRRVWYAIGTLPPKFRAVVALRYAFQMKFSEIGKQLGMPEPTAKTYFSRAKTQLQRKLYTETRMANV
ncbi:sigma-70 family RNA polymerase sigma factor [Ktedonosporobacter rubrisoli]|uniref:Sigma-70 family RNA polymerase sigma factor n=1 Tax=Ktedonosporobacter rubrisoli TaxID=2509675 RepID=A0A4P6JTV2_KTERU|nr:sigma-70 family RNA polymerase sigma factor [Ktedonosporobacter rubrisoli]QBD78712.1 sigma-70 family RNA polymerase sigma factor [Ktedonosporobacter rubrisoli]